MDKRSFVQYAVGCSLLFMIFFPWFVHATDGDIEHIESFNVDITVNSDASIDVREEITYDFGNNEKHGIFRTLPQLYPSAGMAPLFLPVDIHSVSASEGTPAQYEMTTKEDGDLEIKIGDPDETITGEHTYVISYRVENVINRFDDHDELYWNITGNQWSVPIASVSANIFLPAHNGSIDMVCYTGSFASTASACDVTQQEKNYWTMATRDTLYSSEQATLVVGMPRGFIALPAELTLESTPSNSTARIDTEAIEQDLPLRVRVQPGEHTVEIKKLLYAPFSHTAFFEAGHTYTIITTLGETLWAPIVQKWLPLFLLFVCSVLCYSVWHRYGRDAAGRATIIPEYDPPADASAAMVGVLVHQKVQPRDIVAMIIALAVAGYILIRAEEKKGLSMTKKKEYTLIRIKPFVQEGEDALDPAAYLLAKALFGGKEEVTLTDIRKKFHTHVSKIHEQLYDDVVTANYFRAHPQKVRIRFLVTGVCVAIIGSVVSLAAIEFFDAPLYAGFFGLMALQIFIYSFIMPQRTKTGTRAYQHALGFKQFLEVAEKDRMKFHIDPKKFENSTAFFERYIPYAMVLGVEKEWAQQFSDIDAPAWYQDSAVFTPALFVHSLSSFESSAASVITYTPASAGSSGFSGGAGGGFGGGGGGSW